MSDSYYSMSVDLEGMYYFFKKDLLFLPFISLSVQAINRASCGVLKLQAAHLYRNNQAGLCKFFEATAMDNYKLNFSARRLFDKIEVSDMKEREVLELREVILSSSPKRREEMAAKLCKDYILYDYVSMDTDTISGLFTANRDYVKLYYPKVKKIYTFDYSNDFINEEVKNDFLSNRRYHVFNMECIINILRLFMWKMDGVVLDEMIFRNLTYDWYRVMQSRYEDRKLYTFPMCLVVSLIQDCRFSEAFKLFEDHSFSEDLGEFIWCAYHCGLTDKEKAKFELWVKEP